MEWESGSKEGKEEYDERQHHGEEAVEFLCGGNDVVEVHVFLERLRFGHIIDNIYKIMEKGRKGLGQLASQFLEKYYRYYKYE